MNVCFRHGLYRQLGNTNKEVSISKKGIEDLLKEQYDTREVSNYDKTDEILPWLKQNGIAVQDTFKLHCTGGSTVFK